MNKNKIIHTYAVNHRYLILSCTETDLSVSIASTTINMTLYKNTVDV